MKKIKELMHRFGILVIRGIWSSKGERNAQKLGVVILGLCALFSATQASSIQKLFLGLAKAENGTTLKSAQTAAPAPTTPAVTAADTKNTDSAPTSAAPNIVELIDDSEYIVRGLVKEVTDGFENGIPYTQVTVKVSEAFRGTVGAEYTFRQFGLTKPRKMENGKVNLMVTPDGWSKYNSNEDVVLFLRKKAQKTGLQTTAGLGQGKLAINAGNAVSQFDNDGLFENVQVDDKLLNDRDKRLLATKKGPVNTESLISFVRRAVKDKWIEGGKMRKVKK
jgi:hypothetical protein